MSIPNYLQNIKSAGVYRFVFDKSEIPNETAETLRLVVGYSEKGPFNTPVYIESPSDFKTIFGGVSKKLERNGIYFHRMALQALKVGPILALNLKYFDEEKPAEQGQPDTREMVQAYSLDVQSAVGSAVNVLIRNLYNTTRFWTLEPEHLEVMKDTNDNTLPNYVDITATDSKETSCTFFMRGYQPSGYDVTLNTWYSSVLNGKELPEYMENYASTLVSQYFAEVYVFRGEFTPEIATSEAIAKYFDVDSSDPENIKVTLKDSITNAFGDKIDTLQALAQNEASNFVGSYAGCLIPEFQASNGQVIALDGLFNADYDSHKMLMRLNQDMLYNEDITLADIDTTGWAKGISTDGVTPVGSMMSATEIIPMVNTYRYVYTEHINDGEWKLADESVSNPNYNCFVFDLSEDPTNTIKTAYSLSGSNINIGDRFLGAQDESDNCTVATITNIDSTGVQWVVEGTIQGGSDYSEVFDSEPTIVDHPAVDETPEYWTINDLETPKFSAEPVVERQTMTTITFDNDVFVSHETLTNLQCIYKCISSVSATSVNCKLVPTYVEGYTRSTKFAKPLGNSQWDKLNWQKNAILQALMKYEGLRIGLTSNIDVEYHYIVDTFDSYVERELKSMLSMIARLKDNCIFIGNFPKMKTFEQCKYVSFTDSEGNFQTKYIVQGGNHQKPMSLVFGLPTEENGASWTAFYTQVNIKDPSTSIKYTCPSAALVSNCYMDKYQNRHPYSIVAGPDFSRLQENGLIGPDFNFCREDLDNLEPFGVNCIVFAPRQGTYVNSNQSAKQNPVTTLSSINVREVIVYIQDEIENILRSYQWWTNDADLRAKVKSQVDYLLENVKSNGGIYDYETVCSDKNNTDEIIDLGMFIIDVSIEASRGSGKMIQTITLYRKGGISSTTVQ